MSRTPKVQRWVDLIAALLLRHYRISFEQLAKEVPAYQDPSQDHAARMRMFERDKDELRKFGVPIESVEEEGAVVGYVLSSRSFYLPYLQVADVDVPEQPPARPRADGYRALRVLAFEPDEVVMIARAAKRVQSMRHSILAADAATAVRKLAFDVVVLDDGVREIMLSPYGEQDPGVLEELDDAVRRRKHVQFDYRSIERNVQARREVAPYGLLFLSGLWYLMAWDLGADALRHFRVSRIREPRVNPLKQQTADFTVPSDFDLWEHAESRQAWELGDGDTTSVIVRFDKSNGYAAAGASLGTAEDEDPECRRFVVRRPDAFVRWLLSFGGAARPLSPASVVAAWRDLARQTAALYPATIAEAAQ